MVAPHVMFLALATLTPPQDTIPRVTVEVGAQAPALRCVSGSGRTTSWEDLEGPVLLAFLAPQQEYSRRALDDLLRAIHKEPGLSGRATMLLVLSDPDVSDQVKKSLADTSVPFVVAVDAERHTSHDYHVVALPTAFCIDPDRVVRHIVRGYGPMFAFQAVAGLKHAAGLIDQEQFDALLAAKPEDEPSAGPRRVHRYLQLARRLRARGQTEEAQALLENALENGNASVEASALLASILLEQDRVPQALHWIEEVEKQAPDSTELRLLKAEMYLKTGKLEEAEAQLAPFDERMPEVCLLKGRLLEARGQWREAAHLYRQALEELTRQGAGDHLPP